MIESTAEKFLEQAEESHKSLNRCESNPNRTVGCSVKHSVKPCIRSLTRGRADGGGGGWTLFQQGVAGEVRDARAVRHAAADANDADPADADAALAALARGPQPSGALGPSTAHRRQSQLQARQGRRRSRSSKQQVGVEFRRDELRSAYSVAECPWVISAPPTALRSSSNMEPTCLV